MKISAQEGSDAGQVTKHRRYVEVHGYRGAPGGHARVLIRRATRSAA